MALPAGVDGVTVSSGKPLTLPDGTPIEGKLLFAGPDVVTVNGQDVVLGGTIEVRLVNGAFSVTLAANDVTGMNPTGWTYRVTAVFSNAPGWVRYIALPKAASSVTLAQVIAPDPAEANYIPVVGPKGDTGPAGPQPPLGAAGAGDTVALKSTDPTTTNARTPTAHASSHAPGGSDPLTGYLPSSGGAVTGDLSVAGRLTASGWVLPLLAPSTRLPAWRTSSYIQNFQTGHGWTTSGSGLGSSNLNDTSTFVRGTQCATITSAGNAGVANLDRFAQSAFDLTGKAIRLTLKIDDITHVGSVNFFVGTSSLANLMKWKAWNVTASTSMIQSGEWVTVTLQWADINTASGTCSISANGVPSTTSSFTDMRFQIVDDGAGTVTAHLQSVEIIPDTTSTFPTGIVSVTFDDSWHSVHDYARPIMDQYGYRGTTYTIADYIGTSQRLSLAELRSVQNFSGWEVAGHAYTNAAHAARYDTMTAQQVDDELRNLKAWLASNEFTSDAFAYPGGHFAATTDGVPVDQLVGRYFSTGRSINYLNTTEMFPAAMPKRLRSISGISSVAVASDYANSTKLMSTGGPLDRCQLNGSWLILTFHQIVTGSVTDSTQCSQTDFAAIMAAINSRGIPVLPVGDVIRNYL